VKGFNIIVLQ